MRAPSTSFREPHPAASSRRAIEVRAGFTTIELVLVLGLVIGLAAVTVPPIMRMAEQKAITEAAEEVRRALLKAGASAMESAEPYVFRFEEGGRKFGFQPEMGVEGTDDELELRKVVQLEGMLPKGFKFEVPADIAYRTQEEEFFESEGIDLRTAVRFSPQFGEADDREILIRDPNGNTILLTVRGLTGGVRLSSMNPRRTGR